MPPSNRIKFPDNFWSLVGSLLPNDCWPWLGDVAIVGYGRFSLDSQRLYAHRIAYELIKGPIPAGLQIDHLCRNRVCCNPSHLEAVTQQENLRRGNGIAAIHAHKTHCPQGHPYSGENLKINKTNGGRICAECHRNHRRKSVARTR